MADVNGQGGGSAPAAVEPGVVTNMPAVQTPQRGGWRDFDKAKREGTLPAQARANAPAQQQPQAPQQRAEAPQSSANRVAAFQDKLDAKSDPQKGEKLPGLGEETPEQDPQSLAGEGGEAAPAEGAPAKLTDAEIVARYREMEESSFFPEDLAGKMHEVKVRGQVRYVDTNELRQGYMRHGDYIQRGKEISAKESEVKQYRETMDQHFEAIKNDEQFLDIYERNGYADTLEKVADRVIARRRDQNMIVKSAGLAAAQRLGFTAQQIADGAADNHREVVEAMRKTHEQLKRSRQLEIDNKRLEHENTSTKKSAAEKAKAEQLATFRDAHTRQLEQLRPVALRAHGIEDSPKNRAVFMRHLADVVNDKGVPSEGFTSGIVMSAAQAMREELEDRQIAESGGDNGFLSPAEFKARAEAAKRAGGKPLGPNRSGGGLGKPVTQQPERKRASDMAAERTKRLMGG